MKKLGIIALALVALTGCKKNDWLDWKAMNELWLEQNKKTAILPYVDNSGKTYTVSITPSGLQYIILDEPNPTEVRPNADSYINCTYTLDLINTIEDKAYHLDGGTTTFDLSQGLIPGFVEGVRKVRNHGRILLYIPANQAYGEEGRGTDGYKSYVPPYSTLIYDITLNSVN